MIKNKKTLLFVLLVFLSLVVVIKFYRPDNNKEFLNFFAKFLFDESYYVKTYPEILALNIEPFEHFSAIGWIERKNPNDNFDTNFYMNMNSAYKKYKLNPLQHYVKSILSFKSVYTNPNQLSKVEKLLDNPKYYLALVAIFRNEDRFLKEWIEFYRLIGVEHFYLYNHLSDDNFMKVLEPYIRDGIVELKNVQFEPKNLKEWNTLQTDTYTEAVERTKNEVEWLIVVDTDEFMFPTKASDLRSLLRNYDQYATLSVDWKIYGSGGVDKIGSDELLIEKLKWANASQDGTVKSIVKPRYVKRFLHPHFPILKAGFGQINENFEYFSGPWLPYETRNIVRINHYWARDYEFFKTRKLERVHMVDRNQTSNEISSKIDLLNTANKNASSIEDDSILRFVPQMKERMGFYIKQ